jgi:hypothetical protein
VSVLVIATTSCFAFAAGLAFMASATRSKGSLVLCYCYSHVWLVFLLRGIAVMISVRPCRQVAAANLLSPGPVLLCRPQRSEISGIHLYLLPPAWLICSHFTTSVVCVRDLFSTMVDLLFRYCLMRDFSLGWSCRFPVMCLFSLAFVLLH